MFLPSLYKSFQSIPVTNTTTLPLDVAIASVDTNYTRISTQGAELYHFYRFRINLTSAINVRFHDFHNSSGNSGQAARTTLIVEEFVGLFFHQPFYYGTVVLGQSVVTNSVNTGLTLNSKAFLVSLGFEVTFNQVLATSPETTANLALSGSTVTATRTIANSSAGDLTCGFLLIDPK